MLLTCIAVNAQFDTIIFKTTIPLNWEMRNVYALDDQNNDGYDDFFIYNCQDTTVNIYFGGNPPDTIPEKIFKQQMNDFELLDVNNDNQNDLVFLEKGYAYGGIPYKIYIYYGGSLLDTIPDIIFNQPEGSYQPYKLFTLRDFNGDGRDEFIWYDHELPYSKKQYGTFYFYNTGSTFDTIPDFYITGDTINNITFAGVGEHHMDQGDLDNDGYSDFSILAEINYGDYHYIRYFYKGNSSFDMTPYQIIDDNDHSFTVKYWDIIPDINGDLRDDIIISAYGGVYPYYYYRSILYGSLPIDTVQDRGINTQNETIVSTRDVGDVNGDGYNDIYASMRGTGYGMIKLWIGGQPWNEVCKRTWYGWEEGLGRDYAGVGDVNGDGVNDLCICAIPFIYGYDTTVYILKGDTSVKLGFDDGHTNISSYELYQNYPNPFNPSTVISYHLPVVSNVKIKVYDILGREIVTLINEEKPAGRYEMEFNSNDYNLSSGVYLYQLIADDYQSVKKMMILK